MVSGRRPGSRARGVSRLRMAGLIVLAAVGAITVVLVWMATRPVPLPGDVDARPIPGFDGTADAGQDPARLRVIAAASDEVAWRAALTGCSDDAAVTIERSEDAGTTWSTISLGAQDVAAVVDLATRDGGDYVAAIVREGSDCALGARVSMTSGNFWSAEEPPADATYYVNEAIVSGGGELVIPCADPLDFESTSRAEALVICGEGSPRVTTDAGESWLDLALDGSTVAVTAIDGGYLLASFGSGECSGLRMVAAYPQLDGAESLDELACLKGFPEQVPVALGTSPEGAVWAWVGERATVSADGGASWPGSWRRAPESDVPPIGSPEEPSTPTAEPIA